MKLTNTQTKCLEWLADDATEYGCPGGRRTLRALSGRRLAVLNGATMRWEITDAGRMELGPIELKSDGTYSALSDTSQLGNSK